jgi:hypothetical protein
VVAPILQQVLDKPLVNGHGAYLFIVYPARKLPRFAGCFGHPAAKGQPVAKVRMRALNDANNRPDKGLGNTQVMKLELTSADKCHDIGKERVMISHGASFF